MDRNKPASSAQDAQFHAEHAHIDQRRGLLDLARKVVGLLYGSIDFAFISAAVNVRRISPHITQGSFSLDNLSVHATSTTTWKCFSPPWAPSAATIRRNWCWARWHRTTSHRC
ncbi:hypothetical protein [Pseudomonas chlororaphis]|uniref:hypothetical protein n=1 Tax=Pseudomonas chlororaphis TaxID=587753 RepID=UPI000D0FA2FD|nr:hypothetical protein [Pseudomonas chlororaphis]AVO59236.1 hypothetical protein C6Q18_15120 [Pseudomonas chlororaphis subsp. piscium]